MDKTACIMARASDVSIFKYSVFIYYAVCQHVHCTDIHAVKQRFIEKVIVNKFGEVIPTHELRTPCHLTRLQDGRTTASAMDMLRKIHSN
jgi:hypothetical protein